MQRLFFAIFLILSSISLFSHGQPIPPITFDVVPAPETEVAVIIPPASNQTTQPGTGMRVDEKVTEASSTASQTVGNVTGAAFGGVTDVVGAALGAVANITRSISDISAVVGAVTQSTGRKMMAVVEKGP